MSCELVASNGDALPPDADGDREDQALLARSLDLQLDDEEIGRRTLEPPCCGVPPETPDAPPREVGTRGGVAAGLLESGWVLCGRLGLLR